MTVVRQAAVWMEGVVNCTVSNVRLMSVAGNGIFLSHAAVGITLANVSIESAGETGIAIVGSKERTTGLHSFAHPRHCTVSGALIQDTGQIVKGSAGIYIARSADITVKDSLIRRVPRSCITVADGWAGGHVFEYNDLREGVRESDDHGPFNSWGRERFHPMTWWWQTGAAWRPNPPTNIPVWRGAVPAYVPAGAVQLDVLRPIRLHHNRIEAYPPPGPPVDQIGVDLDGGSSHYHVEKNLVLGSTIKIGSLGDILNVTNNIFVNDQYGLGLHYWLLMQNNSASVTKNILFWSNSTPSATNTGIPTAHPARPRRCAGLGYRCADLPALADNNLFFAQHEAQCVFFIPKSTHSPPHGNGTLVEWRAATGLDMHSMWGVDPLFVDPGKGDFRLSEGSPAALVLGIANISFVGPRQPPGPRWHTSMHYK